MRVSACPGCRSWLHSSAGRSGSTSAGTYSHDECTNSMKRSRKRTELRPHAGPKICELHTEAVVGPFTLPAHLLRSFTLASQEDGIMIPYAFFFLRRLYLAVLSNCAMHRLGRDACGCVHTCVATTPLRPPAYARAEWLRSYEWQCLVVGPGRDMAAICHPERAVLISQQHNTA